MGRINILILAACLCAFAYGQQPSSDTEVPAYEFVENQGQWHPLARFKAAIPFGQLYLESSGLLYQMDDAASYHKMQQWRHDNPTKVYPGVLKSHAVRLNFVDVNLSPKLITSNPQPYYFNFIRGNKKENWVSGIHPVSKVVYKDIYPEIDFEISGEKNLKYQWVIHNPSADKLKKIKFQVEGADEMAVQNEQLIIKTSVGEIVEDKPFVYQIIGGEMYTIASRFIVEVDTFGIELTSDFTEGYPLIVDPKLIFSTYSGSRGDNFGFTATYDSKANLYAGGIVNAAGGQNYPVTAGAYDQSYNGGDIVGKAPANLSCDISISKYDSAGTSLLWATYLGGESDEYPHSLVVDRNDDLLIYGTSYSTNFPFTKGCVDSTHDGNTDIIVSKLSEDGTTLMASTFIGGPNYDGLNRNSVLKHNYADDYRGDIITDDDGNVYVASCTESDLLPTINGHQTSKSTGTDGYIFELNPDFDELLWSTYLGGDASDALYSIKLNKYGDVYVGGGSNSQNLPGSDTALYPGNQGNADGIIARFDAATDTLKNLTHFGTSSYDQIYFIDLDNEGNVLATGQTEGSLSQTPGTYGESNKGQFIVSFDSVLTKINFQTTFGNADGAINLAPSAFLVDVCDHIYFSGWGSTVDPTNHPGNTKDLEVTADAEQDSTDENDFYILVLDKNAGGLLYATYFGGTVTSDHVDGGTSRFDKKGVIYQSVCSSCPPSTDGQTTQVSDFPISPGAAFDNNVSVRCSNASFKIDLQIKTAVIADFVANPKVGCQPLDVQFENKSVLGDTLFWDFGDGTSSSEINPKHLYEEPGVYEVLLTVIDSNTCNISSTYLRRIVVLSSSEANFDAEYSVCTNELTITNNSADALEYLWDFGDSTTSSDKDPEHNYNEPGTYNIKLIVNPGTLCEAIDSQEIVVSEEVDPEVVLYNSFSPNGDGINDCFYFDGLDLECSEMRWMVYNRWGEKVFETDNPGNCWNGASFNNGETLPESTYYYILDLGYKSRNSQRYSGTITLFKQ